MPYASLEASKENNLGIYMTGAIFWTSMLIGYGFIFVIDSRRKRFIKQNKLQQKQTKLLPGAIRFFSNRPASIFDILFVISLVGLITCEFTSYKGEMVTYVLLALVVLSFHLHCMFNGKNYIYIKTINMRGVKL